MASSHMSSAMSSQLMSLSLSLTQLTRAFDSCDSHAQMNALNRQARDKLDALKALVEREQDDDKARQEYEGCQRRFRAANLACLRRLKQRDRFNLLESSGSDAPDASASAALSAAAAAKSSGEINASFRQLTQRLSSVVEASKTTMDELVASSQIVSDTEEELQGMSAVIAQSKRLINKFASREVTDRVLIALGFAFFMACVLYIIRKRVMDPFDLMLLLITSLASSLSAVFDLALEIAHVALRLWDDYVNYENVEEVTSGRFVKEEM